MSWVRVDDEFYDHPKFLDLDLAAVGLWTVGLAYCNRYGTDGHIPAAALRRVAPHHDNRDDIAAELVGRGLWDVVDDGWQMRNYHDFQPSAEQMQARKKARQEAGRRGGLAKAKANARADAVAPALARGHNPVPSHPITTTSSSSGLESDPRPVDDDKISTALAIETDRRVAAANPTSPDRYRTTVARQVTTDYRTQAAELAAAYPDITAAQLASVLAGNRSVLRYLEGAS